MYPATCVVESVRPEISPGTRRARYPAASFRGRPAGPAVGRPAVLTSTAVAAVRERRVVCSEGAICLRRRVHLASSHVGRHRMELEDLVLRDGHEIPGKDQEIRQLSGFYGTLHLLF